MADYFERFNNDYKNQFDYEQTIVRENDKNNQYGSSMLPSNLNAVADQQGKFQSMLSGVGEGIKNAITQEISDVRNTLVNRLNQELTVLSSQIQRFVADTIGFNITLTKVNVYYDTPGQAFDGISNFVDDFVDDAIEEVRGNTTISYDNGKLNVFYDDSNNTITPRTGSVNPKGEYNEKYPEGDLHDDGTYNENEPDDDPKDMTGEYNSNNPEGDLHNDGTYNTNKPNGNVYKK
jgi:hypothetical protein